LLADSYFELLVAGLLLGIAGASFAVALPLASRWYPLEHQGLALGIAGAGNSGTVVAALVAPRISEMFGWQSVLGWAAGLIVLTLVVFCSLAQDSPEQPPRKKLAAYFAPLATRDAWTFCAFYCVTFGGFVGLANFLGLFFYEQYGLSRVNAGALTAAAVFGGSMLRPVGGWVADRWGGTRLLVAAFFSIAAIMGLVATLPALPIAILLLTVVMATLGAGNGIVFQLIPQRFQREIGVVTGIVGAAGGVGGFLLPTLLGVLKQSTGSFAPGLACFAIVAGASAVAAWIVSRQWSSSHAIFEPATT
jgi:NNP family nitrate/nitrite transporter-like MFS transporter